MQGVPENWSLAAIAPGRHDGQRQKNKRNLSKLRAASEHCAALRATLAWAKRQLMGGRVVLRIAWDVKMSGSVAPVAAARRLQDSDRGSATARLHSKRSTQTKATPVWIVCCCCRSCCRMSVVCMFVYVCIVACVRCCMCCGWVGACVAYVLTKWSRLTPML